MQGIGDKKNGNINSDTNQNVFFVLLVNQIYIMLDQFVLGGWDEMFSRFV